ncbi:palmitoyltransferase ZDHHC4 [Suncus etruscus]|uniref:palmitoyltransferase ZDHHC4 n=1 Tax=Suncus etruscus TaxID=109475 RepID=UPI00210F29AF|nr:palmitoyltransferase ZDHHC4 [Suncus etruscus]
MDFLFLFLLYLVCLLLSGVLIYMGSRTQYLNGLIRRGTQVFSSLVPGRLQKAVQGLLHYFFHTRNRCFLVLHLLLQGTIYFEYSWEIFGYCQQLGFFLSYLLLPYLLLIVNLVFFILTCVTDPGTVTKANESFFLQAYAFDGVMYSRNARCCSCGLWKPARSKHCSVCGRCVHRFDHHCIWVNNCIGAGNTRFFLGYLCTLMASAATLAVLSAALLLQLVVMADLYSETYVDDQGHIQDVDTIFLVQHLFLSFPRVVFTLGFVAVLSFLLASYLCFLLYLAATNQTTNEWYKDERTQSPHRNPSIKSQNFYSNGLWSNLGEIFLGAPGLPVKKKKS